MSSTVSDSSAARTSSPGSILSSMPSHIPADGVKDDWRPSISGTEFGVFSSKLFDICNRVEALNQLADSGGTLPRFSGDAIEGSTNDGGDGAAKSPPLVRLPRLALLGNQSVGKSSLVEVISGVTLPRSMGTCTRGPIDITTRQPDEREVQSGLPPWFARVTLKLNSAPGQPIAFGDVVRDQSDVASRIRRASLALREGGGYERFLAASEDELDELEEQPDRPTFFTDRIGVEVVGLHMPPLRFTDLPGLVHNAEEHDIRTIKRMVEEEISDPECLIVLTVSLAVDIATQSAFRTALSKDPERSRTIGVFTMPDRMQPDSGRQWISVVNGSGGGGKHGPPLKHGWHVVRCPPSDEKASATLSAKHDSERRFFAIDSTPFRRELVSQLGSDFLQKRCGIDRLTDFLSELLLSRLREMVPACYAAVYRLLMDKHAELAELQSGNVGGHGHGKNGGNDGSDGAFEPSMKISELCSSFKACFERRRPVDDSNRRVQTALLEAAPRLYPFTREEVDNEDIVGGYFETPWTFAPSVEGNAVFASSESASDRGSRGGSAGGDPFAQPWYLDTVRDKLESAGPNYVYRLLNLASDFERSVRRKLQEGVLVTSMRQIRRDLNDTLRTAVEATFSGYPDLESKVHEKVLAILTGHLHGEEARIKELVKAEITSDDLCSAEKWSLDLLQQFRQIRLHASLVGAKLSIADVAPKAEAVLQALSAFGIEATGRSRRNDDTFGFLPSKSPTSSSGDGGQILALSQELADKQTKEAYEAISHFLPSTATYYAAELRAMAQMRSIYNLLSTNLYNEICRARERVLARTAEDMQTLALHLCSGRSDEQLCEDYFSSISRRRAERARRTLQVKEQIDTLEGMKRDLVALGAGTEVARTGAAVAGTKRPRNTLVEVDGDRGESATSDVEWSRTKRTGFGGFA